MKQPQHINKQVPTYKIITAYYEKATYNEKHRLNMKNPQTIL